MKYEIISKNDSLAGVHLVVQIAEEDLDRKALYTVQHDMPNFLVPFQSRCIDGKVELLYRLEDRSKLRYYNGQRAPDEYVGFWESLLQPLLECDEWFLKPYSFVLDPDHLYRNRDGSISYLYIPACQDCSSYEDLKSIVARLAKDNSVSDPELENVVLRMLVQDFHPKSFLEALRKSMAQRKTVVSGGGTARQPLNASPVNRPQPQPPRPQSQPPQPQPTPPKPAQEPPVQKPREASFGAGEIHIDLGGGAKAEKKKGFSLFGGKETKDKKKKEKDDSKKKKSRDTDGGVQFPAPDPVKPAAPTPPPAPVYEPPVDVRPQMSREADETQLEEFGTCLRLVGAAGLPKIISVSIEVGGAFTIGRFDKTVGRKQSDFEFEPGTKAVSRHHAAIERDVDGYTITDLASKAGTFVNGVAIRPNVPYRLSGNARISFGTSGADYVWGDGEK